MAKRQGAIASAIEAARRGDDSLPVIPDADPDGPLASFFGGEGSTEGSEGEGAERDDAALRSAYLAAEYGVPTPAINAQLGHVAAREKLRWRGLGNDAAVPPDSFGPSPTPQGTAPWRTLGPYWARSQFNGTYYKAADSGRVNVVRVHPTDSNIVFIATSGGGLWKHSSFNDSSAAKATTPVWVSVTDTLGSLAVGAFDLSASNPSVLYIGLGDHVDQQFGAWSKTSDGGATWSAPAMLTATHPRDGATVSASNVRSVAIDPADPNHVFMATDAGLFVSTDGATFSIANLPKVAGYDSSRDGAWTIAWLGGTRWVVSGVYACPGLNGPNVALVMGGAAACPAPNASLGNLGDIWTSSDNGATWSSVRAAGGLAAPLAVASFGRMNLAAVPNSTDPAAARVYAIAGSIGDFSSNSTVGIWRSDDGGATWTVKSRTPAPATVPINPVAVDCTNMNMGHGQSYYDLAIAADPGNADNVIVGGDLCSARTRDGGATWELTSHWLPTSGRGTTVRGPLPYVHADWHGATVSRVGGKVLVFAATDGGMFVSRDYFDRDFAEQIHWDQPSYGIATHLLYSVGSGDPTTGNPSTLLTGLQDNGTRWLLNSDTESISTSFEIKVWDQIIGGDGIGTAVALDPTGLNPTVWASVQFSRRFCRPRARDCGLATRVERGTERGNYLAINFSSILGPLGDAEPFLMRYADLGDGWVASASSLNLWRFRPTANDGVQFARLTTNAPPAITGCGTTGARSIRGVGPGISPPYTIDGVPARLYGLPLNGGCFAVVTDKTPPGGTVNTTTTGAVTSLRANDASGNLVTVSFTSSIAFPRNPANLGGSDPRQTYVAASSAPGGLNANSFAVLPIPAEVGRLFKTTNNGATWVPFHGNGTSDLPNVPVFVVRFDYSDPTDQTIYVGTDLGLYRTTDGGATWARVGVGLPLVRVTDIHISKNGSVVRAATYGRGMWEIHVKSQADIAAGDGDYDKNGVIDWFDLSALATRMGVAPLTNPPFPSVPWYDTAVDLGGANPALIQDDDLTALAAKFGGTP